jgi:hypothetical protein
MIVKTQTPMKTKSVLRHVISGLIIVFFLTSFSELHAQYKTAVGFRVGGTTGIDGKFFTRQGKAIEAIVGGFGNGMSFTALVEKYSPVYNATGLYVYYGGGGHLAFYNSSGRYYGYFGRDIDYHRNNDVGFGINGIVGLEYRLPDGIPISFSADLKPFIEMTSGGYIGFAPDPSIGVKIILK